MSARVVITGAGAVTPLGPSRAALAAALHERDAGAPSQPAIAIGEFDASGLPEARSLRRATAHVLYGVAAAAESLREAGEGAAPEDSGLVFASALGSARFSYRLWHDLLKSGPLGASPVLFSEGVPNALAGHVAHSLKLLGPGHMLGGGSDAGLRAVALALDLLRCGRARRIVAGAAEEHSEIAARAYGRLGVAARARREGQRRGVTRGRALVMGEGAAALVLEPAEPAAGRRALAAVLAAESVQLPRAGRAEDAEPLAALLLRAIEAAGVAPDAVGWLGRAANGTHVDALEEAALARLADERFAPERSTRARAALGDAFTLTPLLQVIEALEHVAGGGVAAILSISLFGASTALLIGPPPRADRPGRAP